MQRNHQLGMTRRGIFKLAIVVVVDVVVVVATSISRNGNHDGNTAPFDGKAKMRSHIMTGKLFRRRREIPISHRAKDYICIHHPPTSWWRLCPEGKSHDAAPSPRKK